jgi:hypothetical protein
MITEAYKKLNAELHKTDQAYGISGIRYVELVRELSNWGRRPILDYGCGKAMLSQQLGPAYRVTNYDPCIEGLDARPMPHDVVVCTDVMEHVEPEFVDDVLKDIRRLAKEFAFFSICIRPAQKILADGRNAHISLHPVAWWKERVTAAGFAVAGSYDDDDKHTTFGYVCK